MPLQPYRDVGQVDANLQGIGAVKNIQEAQFGQKRNQLMDLRTDEFNANAPVREATREAALTGFEQVQQDRMRTELLGMSNDFVNTFDQGGKEAALGYLATVKSGSQDVLKIRDEAIAALNSPDPQDDINVLAQARGLQQSLTQKGDSKAAPVGHPFGVQYKDPQTGETVQGTAFIRNDSGSGTTQMMFLGQNGQPVQGVTEWKRTNTSGQTPSQEAATDIDEATKIAVAKEQAVTDALPERMDAKMHQTRKEQNPQKRQQLLSVKSGVNDLLGEITDAFSNTNYWTTGVGGAITSHVPGTTGFELKNTFSSILSDVGFDRLQKMRDESPTGGALGQVSNFEIDLLKASLTGISQLEDPEAVRKALLKVRGYYKNVQWLNNKNLAVSAAVARGENPAEIRKLQDSILTEYEGRLSEQGRKVEHDWDAAYGSSGSAWGETSKSATSAALEKMGVQASEQAGELTPRQQRIADIKAELDEKAEQDKG